MEFTLPDMSSPLDTEERLSVMPADASIKGLFFSTVIGALKEKCPDSELIKDYVHFNNYPCKELIQLLDKSSSLLYPDIPQRLALRLLGQRLFRGFKKTTAGMLFYTAAGQSVANGFQMINSIYNLLSQTKANILEVGEDYAIIGITDAWVFPTCYHVGTYEGAIMLFNKNSKEVLVKEYSICNVDILCRWEN